MRKLLIIAFFTFVAAGFSIGEVSAKTAVVSKSKTVVVKAVAKKPVVVKKTTKAVPAKKVVTKKPAKKATVCVKCKSLAEGVDRSAAAKAASWKGTVIGLNEGEKSVVITEATKLNRIKAYPQRSILIDEDTKIIGKEGDELDFVNLDIGYRIEVKGSYDAKKRQIHASNVEIFSVPDQPITKTK